MKHDFGTADILSRREAAEYLGICRTTLDRLERIRHRVVYKRDTLSEWLDAHTEKGKGNKA